MLGWIFGHWHDHSNKLASVSSISIHYERLALDISETTAIKISMIPVITVRESLIDLLEFHCWCSPIVAQRFGLVSIKHSAQVYRMKIEIT